MAWVHTWGVIPRPFQWHVSEVSLYKQGWLHIVGQHPATQFLLFALVWSCIMRTWKLREKMFECTLLGLMTTRVDPIVIKVAMLLAWLKGGEIQAPDSVHEPPHAQPAVQSPERADPPPRRSSRKNKGKTTKFQDYVGDEELPQQDTSDWGLSYFGSRWGANW